MAKQVTFALPDGEYEQLAKLRRNPNEGAKDMVRAALYRQRHRDSRIAYRKQQREERSRVGA